MDNLFKKISLLFFLSASTVLVGYSQFSFGAGTTLGFGYLRSSDLKQSGKVVEDANPNVQNLDFKAKATFQVGFQGVVQYRFAQQWCVVASPGFRLFRSTFNNIYIENETVSSTDYITHKVISLAKFKCTQLQLPIIAKYYFTPDKPYFATGGFAFSYNAGMKMYSEEDSITTYYSGDNMVASNKKDIEFSKIKVDGYKPFQAHLVLGIGASLLTGYRRNLDVELSYYVPLTSSPYYTTNADFTNQSLTNGWVYSADGKAAYEQQTGKSLDHYRMHMITLTIRYLFYSINK